MSNILPTIYVIAADLEPERLGGAEQHVVEVIRRLDTDFNFHVFVGKNFNTKNLFSKRVSVHTVYYPRIPNIMGIMYILFAMPKIWQANKHLTPDIIWAKQLYPQAILGVWLKYVTKKPLYTTIQNPRLIHEEYTFTNSLLRKIQPLIAWLMDPIISFIIKKSDINASISTYSHDHAEKYGSRKSAIIPNGINMSFFKNHPKSKDATLTILSTSSLIPRNGLEYLVKSAKYYPQDLDWEIIIAGEGPLRNSLENMIMKQGQKDKIHLLGRVANSKIIKLIASADIFIRPSIYEGLGVSFLEAMAARVPIITTDAGGIGDIIKHKKTGIVVSTRNPQQIAKEVQWIIEHKEETLQMTQKAYEVCKKGYTWDNIAKLVNNEFKNLIG